ncbi:hypothetical protein DUNSADRAFT_18406 [Dunaliella salina]|uniref:Encoded protein n=1 Tax=Dunaliella salina TaxID=3046 RepID=A0ABQ7GZ66_DUNSA|nr:hypothetical protein DUNSADRAFT_18406 [Dunaliella salina]|eukprot:KAF5839863.1 hypothetical protein DUNSADRAFT_18406 [Dunaliella salina]
MPKKGDEVRQQRIPIPEKRKVPAMRREGPLAKKSRVSASSDGTANAPATRRQMQQKQGSEARELRPRSAPQALCPQEERSKPSSSQAHKPASVPASKPKKQAALTTPKVLQRLEIHGEVYKVKA